MFYLNQMIDGLHQLGNKSGIININPELWHKVIMPISDKVERIRYITDKLKTELDKSGDNNVEIGPMILKNPVGLAAGFAKKSNGLKLWEAFGFGFLTIGGITAKAQNGNLKPRIFKFPEIQSIVNGMGLPGDGLDAEINRLAKRKKIGLMLEVPIIANLCNSATTPEDQKIDEFKLLMEKLFPYVDGFEINVSCPNQGGVCDMQQESKLKKLLTELEFHNKSLAIRNGTERKALLVKIAPLTKYESDPEKIRDLTLAGLELIANVCNQVGIDGVTATNTSQEHGLGTQIKKPDGSIISGGFSGLGLFDQSLRTVKELRSRLDKNIPIIGTGGVGYDYKKSFSEDSLDDLSAIKMINNGASAVGILSSFVQGSFIAPSNLNYAIKRYWEINGKIR